MRQLSLAGEPSGAVRGGFLLPPFPRGNRVWESGRYESGDELRNFIEGSSDYDGEKVRLVMWDHGAESDRDKNGLDTISGLET